MRAFQKCWNQEKHISLFILWWRSKHHLLVEWADILKEYGMSRKSVLALELSTCDIRSPRGMEEKSWPLSRAMTAMWVTTQALKSVCWVPTVRFFSQLWDNAEFVLYSFVLNCIFKLLYNKIDFYVHACYNIYIFFTMEIILHEKNIHSLKSF